MSLDCLGAICIGADPSLDDVASGAAVLRRGSKGDAVRYVQEHLAFTGSDVDGDFGAKTEARVKEFQIAKGLRPADGVVGKDTMAAIDAMVMAGQRFSPVPTASPAVAVSRPAASTSPPMASKPALVSVPSAESLKATPIGTKVAYALGAVAVGGMGYAFLRKKR